MTYIDLSHTFKTPVPTWPGEPDPELSPIVHGEFKDHLLKTELHMGTHVDAPAHNIEHGESLDEIALERFVGRGVLIDAREKPEMDVELLSTEKIERGDVVLFLTGFGSKYGQDEYYKTYPAMTERLADELTKRSVKMVGIDTPSVDRAPFPLHKVFLGNDILLLENLTNLDALIDIPSFEVMAFPPKFHAEGSPVRVVARVT